MARLEVARLPIWEKEILLAAGETIMGLDKVQDSGPLDRETLEAILP